VNNIEREVLEDAVRASGHRRQYRKGPQATLHVDIEERQLQRLDLVIVVTYTIANTTLDDPFD
jgi:hypothetical protein